jgi:hypothetical protein
VDAFATAAELGARLNRTFTPGAETAWITTLLEDASTHLRTVIGQQVFPRQTVTYTAYPSAGREDLPQYPVVSIGSVQRAAADIEYSYRPGFIMVDGDEPCDVTFTFGWVVPPDELKRLACVLVSSALLPLENKLGLTAGGLSSVAIDDFKLAWADAGEQSGMSLTSHAEASIRKQFGRGDVGIVETGW